MMDAALENGGRDNITIIVLDVSVRSSADPAHEAVVVSDSSPA